MKTLLNRTFILSILLIICLSSCGQKVSHKEALDYCVKIQLQMKDAKASLEQSWHELGENIKIAKQSPSQKLDPVMLDTIKKHYAVVMTRLDNNIKTVSAVKETDQKSASNKRLLNV